MLFRTSDLLGDFERLTRGLNLGSDFDEMVDGLSHGFKTMAGPGVDTVSTPTAVEFHIDLPGVDPATVDLTVDGRTVTLTAERTFTVADDAEIVHRGRRHGSFSRTFRLAPDLDTEGLTARSENGVLIVSIPKTEAAQPRKVEISIQE